LHQTFYLILTVGPPANNASDAGR